MKFSCVKSGADLGIGAGATGIRGVVIGVGRGTDSLGLLVRPSSRARAFDRLELRMVVETERCESCRIGGLPGASGESGGDGA
jgi:hypothetical protein